MNIAEVIAEKIENFEKPLYTAFSLLKKIVIASMAIILYIFKFDILRGIFVSIFIIVMLTHTIAYFLNRKKDIQEVDNVFYYGPYLRFCISMLVAFSFIVVIYNSSFFSWNDRYQSFIDKVGIFVSQNTFFDAPFDPLVVIRE